MATNSSSERTTVVATTPADVQLRRLPFPYRSMMAVCSDLDETPDRDAYASLMAFLNTHEVTPMGSGVGLEVGNSIYFDMPEEQFSYWNTDDRGREMVKVLIRSGHIDCLHSFGDLATTRGRVARALEELYRHDCRMCVWVDHGIAPTNLGADIMRGHGDEEGHAAFHVDLLRQFGVRYVWRGRVTSVVGQDRPFSIRGIGNVRHPIRSARTVLKEFAKHVLALRGDAKYRLHRDNRAVARTVLRDGSAVWEFLRCNPHWGGVSSCDDADGIGEVLTPCLLDRLVEVQGVCLLYTHLGKSRQRRIGRVLSESAVAAFRTLAGYYRAGQVLVATTRRLLDYLSLREGISVNLVRERDVALLDVRTDSAGYGRPGGVSPDVLQGLSFRVAGGGPLQLRVNGRLFSGILRIDVDDEGGRTAYVPWKPLQFPGLP